MLPFQSCSEWGLQGTLRRRSVGGLLPRLSILTAKAAVYFCCTFLEVAFTGCYPAPCPVELGLSSHEARSLVLLDPYSVFKIRYMNSSLPQFSHWMI